MEYPAEPIKPVDLVLNLLTDRINQLDSQVASLAGRLDEANNITAEAYADQVVEQIMLAMPRIQANAAKAARGKRK